MKRLLWMVSLLGILASLLLASCGGPSNNLSGSSGSGNSGGTIVSSCQAIPNNDKICVQGRFVDDVVANLNYSCDIVRSTTDSGGTFTCPEGSTVSFYLVNDGGTSRVDLGSVKVAVTNNVSDPSNVSNNTSQLSIPGYLVVTPRTLAGDDSSEGYSNTARNISRLLYLMGNDLPATAPRSATDKQDHSNASWFDNKPIASHVITITAADKNKISALGASMGATDFALIESDFNARVAPLVSQMSIVAPWSSGSPQTYQRTLPTWLDVTPRMDSMLHATRAGLYMSPSGFFSGLTNAFAGVYGDDGSMQFFGFPLFISDRGGHVFGMMEASYVSCGGVCTSSGTNSFLSAPQLLNFEGSNTPFKIISHSGQFNVTVDLPQKPVSFDKGRFFRDYVVGSSAGYQTVYKVDSSMVPVQDLGHLSMSGNASFNGYYTLTRSVVAAPTLNPSIWPQLTFPLYLNMTFLDSTASPGQSQGNINVAILSDGNIVTSDGQCTAIPDNYLSTMQDANGQSIYPVGVVNNVFEIGTNVYLSPTLLFPTTLPANVAGSPSVVGINMGVGISSPLRLRVGTDLGSGVITSTASLARFYGNTVDKNNNPLPDDSTNPATWINIDTYFRASATKNSQLASQASGSITVNTANCANLAGH